MGDEASIVEFVKEWQEFIRSLRRDLRHLELNLAKKREEPGLVNSIHRTFHSMKGNCGVFGYSEISEFCKHLEVLVNNVRLKVLKIDIGIIRIIEDCMVSLEKCFPVDCSQVIPNVPDGDSLLEKVIKINESCSKPEDIQGLELKASIFFPKELTAPLQAHEEALLIDCFKKNQKIFVVSQTFDINDFDQGIQELENFIKQFGVVIALLSDGSVSDNTKIGFKILFATDLNLELVVPVIKIIDEPDKDSDVFEDNDIPELPG